MSTPAKRNDFVGFPMAQRQEWRPPSMDQTATPVNLTIATQSLTQKRPMLPFKIMERPTLKTLLVKHAFAKSIKEEKDPVIEDNQKSTFLASPEKGVLNITEASTRPLGDIPGLSNAYSEGYGTEQLEVK